MCTGNYAPWRFLGIMLHYRETSWMKVDGIHVTLRGVYDYLSVWQAIIEVPRHHKCVFLFRVPMILFNSN